VAVDSSFFHRIIDALPEVTRGHGSDYDSYSVRGKRFGYYWPRTQTVGLKQLLHEQQALVAERPDVFEVQFTAASAGWWSTWPASTATSWANWSTRRGGCRRRTT